MLRLGDYHTEEQDDFERTLSPERIVLHRKYHNQGWEYDIALLRLKGTEGNCVAFNPHTGAVCLPEPGNKWEKRPAACVITGWGITGNLTAQTNKGRAWHYAFTITALIKHEQWWKRMEHYVFLFPLLLT